MADRYWVGGTGTWNTTSTTNWSDTSGGSGGFSVPTVADNVIFDQAGTYTVTMTGALACLDITVSAGTVTFATGTSPTLDIRGSMSLLAGTVWSATGTITFSATTTGKTVTTNGTTIFGSVLFNGAGGEWTFGSALTIGSATFTLNTGTVNTANFALTTFNFNISSALARTLNLGSSTVTISASSTGSFAASSTTNLTFNAGTSQINLSGGTAGISSGGLAFNNVSFTSTTALSRTITGVNTYNNLTVTGPASSGVVTVTFAAQQTINGTLSTTGTAGNQRVFFASATYGISVDLVVNSAPSLTDADFRGLYVRGTSAPISGTRIGNRGECRNITFSTPKTVYWNLAGTQGWTATAWATTATGTPSIDNFPLPQDTATFTNSGAANTVQLDASGINYVPSVDMSGRTSAMTLNVQSNTVYGNWTNGSGVSLINAATLTFSGGGTQTITSAGKTFPGNITIDTYGGIVQLADPFDIGTNTLTITNGTFSTQNNAVTAGILSSNNSNVRTINLGSSDVALSSTLGPIVFTTSTNLTFNAGTSAINITVNTSGSGTINFGGQTYYSVTYVNNVAASYFLTFAGTSTFTNLTLSFPNSAVPGVLFSGDQTVTGTLSCAGTSAVRRIFLQSSTIDTQRTLTVNSLSANDCDFRDIVIAGAAAGSSPTRAGDCGNNTGITFPAPKTVYWNLAGAQSWNATGWATSSGGTPAVNNFPLAQDTAVFDDTGSVTGTITLNAAWNIGTFDASNRTSAMTLSVNITNSPVVYGNWTFGTGVTLASTGGTLTFSDNGTQTITSNGVQFGCNVNINRPSATVQLADALSLNSARTLTLTTGTFDAVTYNVTTGLFSNSSTSNTLRMGSGTWTLSGTGTVWNCVSSPTLITGTSTIVLSDTSTTARTFAGGSGYYNKLTIGGTTGTSTLTISGGTTYGELASTKTVAHTILFATSTTFTVGKWSVTGTAGNVVTVNSTTAGTVFTLSIAGPANSGIDYLSVRDCTVSATSPGEFYVGVNSTNVSGNTRVIFTATPAPRTLYWVGGTGNWSSTTKWSTSSGGGSGAAIPTSLDAVNFDSASNATAYTATIDAGVTLARCASFTMAGPAAGNVTFAGTVGIAFHGNVSFAATGITRTYTGTMSWAGNASYTFNTNGLALASSTTVIGVGSTWTLSNPWSASGSTFTVTYGTFSTSASNHNLTALNLSSTNSNIRVINLNGSTLTLSASTPLSFATSTNLTFTAGTSTITMDASAPGFNGGGQTFYNASFTSTVATAITVTGANTFTNLTFAGKIGVGITAITFSANQTINGTLTVNAGTASAYRNFLASDTLGTTRTLTCAAVSATDVDFRDITIAGAAAPISGTRLGDAKGNSGITFSAAKTVYWALAGSNNWGNTGAGSWAATSGGAAAADQFPLPQDTAYIPFATPNDNTSITVNANYNIGTLDMSNRNGSARVTLATGTTTPTIYGNWINGTGTTLNGSGRLTYAGRGAQQITSAGKTFTQQTTINSLGGSVTLQDAWVTSSGTNNDNPQLLAGTFDANGYNVTNAGTGSFIAFSSTGTLARTIAIGSGTWTFSGAASPWNVSGSNTTVTGSGTLSFTNASAKTFLGGGISYSGITLNQGGAGALTISGNNTFKTITNTYSATGATSISLGGTTTTLTNPWTATGEAGRVLTVSGTSAGSPGTLVYTGAGFAASAVDYLTINNVRAYVLTDEWYAGVNSTNGGSLGWYFVAAGGTVYAATITETGTGTDSIVGGFLYLGTVSELASSSDAVGIASSLAGFISETGSASDIISARSALGSAILESATITDTNLARLVALAAISETGTATDSVATQAALVGRLQESATAQDAINAPGSTYSTLMQELAQAQDAIRAQAVFPASLAETATGTETNSAAFIPLATISESATITDAASALQAFAANISETSAAADSVLVAPSIFNAIAVAAATAIDNFNPAGSIYNVTIPESATLSDSVIGAYLWNLINDAQNANWTTINDAQSGTWIDIDDSQNPGWQNT